jgi:hypothetical protein
MRVGRKSLQQVYGRQYRMGKHRRVGRRRDHAFWIECGSDWTFEIKLDGYRVDTVFGPTGNPHLSRNALSLEAKFPVVAKAVSRLKLRRTILGGEIVAVDETGIPQFQLPPGGFKSNRLTRDTEIHAPAGRSVEELFPLLSFG